MSNHCLFFLEMSNSKIVVISNPNPDGNTIEIHTRVKSMELEKLFIRQGFYRVSNEDTTARHYQKSFDSFTTALFAIDPITLYFRKEGWEVQTPTEAYWQGYNDNELDPNIVF
jgi:hypothetical protein